MYDLQTRSLGKIHWLSWSARITWWSLHWWLQNEWESGGSGGHQPPFPEWWDNLPPTVQKTVRQQHHLCSWGYNHQSGTELLPTRGTSPSRWTGRLNVLFTGNWVWRHREPFYLPYHKPALVIEWQRHTCSFLLDTDPLASVDYTYLKPLVNSYIQQLVQTQWDVVIRGRDLYLGKPTLGQQRNSNT